MKTKTKFLVYCGMTCLGGSEKKQCACDHPNVCEMRDHPLFEEYRKQAQERMFRFASAQIAARAARTMKDFR